MKIICDQQALAKAAGVVQNTISTKNTLPILGHVLLETTNSKEAQLSATDLELGMTVTFPGAVQEEGAIALPAKRFNDIARELPEGEVTMTSKKNNQLIIECQDCSFKVLGLPREEFPKLPTHSDHPTLSYPQNELRRMLSLTAFAMSRDESRYVLNGTLFVIRPNSLRLVATDGRRLAYVEQTAQFSKQAQQDVVVPFKAVHELLRLLQDEGEVRMTIREKEAIFTFGGVTMISRLIEGEFPRYEQVVPKETKQPFKVDRAKFLQAAKRASLLTTPNSQSIQIDLMQSKMVVSKHAAEVGEAREELSVPYQGQDLTIGFNPQYLIDVLKSVDQAEVDVELTHPERPGVIRTDEHYLYLVLPMQLG